MSNINNTDNSVDVINPITKKIKEDWITALRCGEYKQGTGLLCDSNILGNHVFCCLGVLADITGIETSSDGMLDSLDSFLLLSEIDQNTLIRLNDDIKLNFNQIADWISDNINPEE